MAPSLEASVLQAILPKAAERRRIAAAIDHLVARTREAAQRLGAPIQPQLVGSVAKDTHLTQPDLDLFLMFPPETPRETLEAQGLGIGHAVLDGEERYAEHPYVRGTFEGFRTDLVPCYAVAEPSGRMSAVDRTPFHTAYVKAHLPARKRNEVRLLKQFLRGVGVYGAEARVQGFSGYLCEVLILKHGSFRGLLRAAKGWRRGTELTLEGPAKRKFAEPLVVIDPVDPERNIASAASEASLLQFIEAAKAYLQRPRKAFFFPPEPRPFPAATIKKRFGTSPERFLVVEVPRPQLVDDVLWPQLRKSQGAIADLLSRHEFVVERGAIVEEPERLWLCFQLERGMLSELRKHQGPPTWTAETENFRAKWTILGESPPFIEKGRWYVIARRTYPRAEDLLRAQLRDLSLGRDLKELEGLEVHAGKALLDPRFRQALSRFLDSTPPWARPDQR